MEDCFVAKKGVAEISGGVPFISSGTCKAKIISWQGLNFEVLLGHSMSAVNLSSTGKVSGVQISRPRQA